MGAPSPLIDRPSFWLSLMASGWLAAIVIAVSPDIWHSAPLLVHNDGRHFVVWLRQLADPALFAADPIADHFRALTPALYTALFLPAAWLGIDVLVWHLLVVAPLVCLLFTLTAFRFARHIFSSVRLAGFAALALTALLAASPASGLPRGFAFVIVFAALSAFLEGRTLLLCVVLFVGANLYPAAVIVASGAIGLFVLMPVARNRFGSAGSLARLAAVGASAVVGLGVFVLQSQQTGGTLTLAEASRHPIFAEGGRAAFFRDSLAAQLLCEGRGGLLPIGCLGGDGALGAVLALLAVVATLIGGLAAHRALFDLADARTGAAGRLEPVYRLLAALLLAGLLLFVAAYMVAFRAHLPARYAYLSLGLVHALAVASLAVILLEGAARLLFGGRRLWLRQWAGLATALVAAVLIFAKAADRLNLVRDSEPEISAFLRAAPADAKVAGFSRALDNVPAFSSRSVYVAFELLIPYKKEYLARMEARLLALADAYARSTPEAVEVFLADSAVTHVLLARRPRTEIAHWLASYPVLAPLSESGRFEALRQRLRPCLAIAGRQYDLYESGCLAAPKPAQPANASARP